MKAPPTLPRPTVSILINNHDYAGFVAGAIDSALQQTLDGVEVIVVDDGSTDGSDAVLARYEDRVTVLRKPNGGQASAFNAGFARSRGDIVCFLDADDRFAPNKVERIVRVLGDHPKAAWCFHALRKVSADTGEDVRRSVEHGTGPRDLRAFMRLGWSPFHPPSTSGLCFRRDLLARILPMPESRGVAISDNYLKEVATALAPGYFLDEPLATILLHGANASEAKLRDPLRQASKTILTALEMRRALPALANHCNRMAAKGWSIYRRAPQQDPTIDTLIATYLGERTPFERGLIRAASVVVPFRAIR